MLKGLIPYLFPSVSVLSSVKDDANEQRIGYDLVNNHLLVTIHRVSKFVLTIKMQPIVVFIVKTRFRPHFTSKLVHGLAFRIPKFYIESYDKINHGLVNLSSNCDLKSSYSGSAD